MSDTPGNAEWITEPDAEALQQAVMVSGQGNWRMLERRPEVQISLDGMPLKGTIVGVDENRRNCLVFTHTPDGKLREVAMPVSTDIQRRVAALMGEVFTEPKSSRLAEPVPADGEPEENAIADLVWTNDGVRIAPRGGRCRLQLTTSSNGMYFDRPWMTLTCEAKIAFADLNLDEGGTIEVNLKSGDASFRSRERALR